MEVVSEFDELIMCPIHVGGCDPLLCGYGSGVNDDQQSRVAAAIPKVLDIIQIQILRFVQYLSICILLLDLI